MNIVYFLRGLPGSGKSSLAKELEQIYEEAEAETLVVCADDFFIQDGVYKFDGDKIDLAHKFCHERFIYATEAAYECIIVCNVSAEEKHINWYKDKAELEGYRFISLIVENRHGTKSIHAVPEASMERMKRKFSVQL